MSFRTKQNGHKAKRTPKNARDHGVRIFTVNTVSTVGI